jgi:RNA polymerase sigma-70 factor (ECF subfamily)
MDAQEFAVLAANYMTELYNAARRTTGNTQDAEDLAQDVYVRAFQTRRQLKDPACCRAWLYRIMRNLWIDGLRRKHARPELVQLVLVEGGCSAEEDGFPACMASAEEEVLRRRSAQEIRRALDGLPEEFRTVLLLCDIEGFTYAEIAEIMDCPLGTVRSRIARARQKLLRQLRPQTRVQGD